ncbi:hypothetical protein [Polaromonas sp.]|uniref:hypothetical protein n=1 Tax=Polaromonas sp. TaxID=1869339 RepID=UPI00248988CC|nr:hypothetical protein [Polaromonas sp.]MDI1272966.1 hypothetical protein [Polaromonas sp.]
MSPKTNFSFELHYPALAGVPEAQRTQLMASLGPTLQALFAAGDSAATVVVSDSHKGSGHKIVELVTTLPDMEIAAILKAFSEQHGLSVQALE